MNRFLILLAILLALVACGCMSRSTDIVDQGQVDQTGQDDPAGQDEPVGDDDPAGDDDPVDDDQGDGDQGNDDPTGQDGQDDDNGQDDGGDDIPVGVELEAGKHTVTVEMADGVRLSTDVFIPEGAGPWPVMMVRTPYDKQWERDYAEEVNADGFAFVAQDMRGRFESEGENIPLIGEDLGAHRDGYETFRWVYHQPWCNGRIGTLGGSALGMTQLYSAPGDPPGLACQFIGVAPASMYHEFVYPGGAFRQEQMEIWLDVNGFSTEALDLYYEHDTYNEFWHQFDVRDRAESVTVPGMHFGGWFDTFSQGTINTFLTRQHGGGEGARGRQWLVLGPWTHGEIGALECGELILPAVSAQVPDNPYQSFMDFFLKDAANGFETRPAVTYYVLGDVDDLEAPGNEWRLAESWPPLAVNRQFYLQPGGGLGTAYPQASGTAAWSFDPTDPPPTIGGRNLMIDSGVYDQRIVELRDDVVVFETPELTEPVEVTGRVRCRFWVSCDAVDTDVAVRLCDVYPDGRSMLMLDGIQRLRYRDSMQETSLITPGEVYEVEVDLWSISIVFNAGHRIRLSVCGGNNPRWDVNPGTGVKWDPAGAYVVQNTTLHMAPERPSALVLPVVE